MTVKLTVKVPDTLRRRAKAVAALRGESISQVVRAALEDYIEEALDEAEDVRAVDEIESCIAAGQEPIYDHEDVWAEIEALEAEGALSP